MKQRFFEVQDAKAALWWLASAFTVRSLPQRLWLSVASSLSEVGKPGAGEVRRQKYRRILHAVFGEGMSDEEIDAIFQRSNANRHRVRMIVAALRRPQGWDPTIELVGREKIEEAKSRGHGVILWFDTFSFFPLIGKRAIAEAGHQVWHLSGSGHGLASNSKFSHRFLNHRVISVEERYLAGRIVIKELSGVPAMRRIVEILDENGIVEITNAPYFGKRMTVPFGDRAELPIARAPLNLAATRGAALFPVSVIEVEPFARFRVAVGPEIRAPANAADPIAAMAEAYANYLLPLARAHADQWNWWNLEATPAAA
jgi:lauroyl/myristoyl acyltransferase